MQLALVLRFMMDNTQTPNSRVKVALLNYLTALVRDMQPTDLTAITNQFGSTSNALLFHSNFPLNGVIFQNFI